ncbi:cysteine--tRNA ligase, partial [candidate division WOR-3 bacterium]|nr:cysteine--tRNA ligase [candidate division WOR-3 bacterium]
LSMGLRLYNTLNRKTEDFVPLADPVKIYTCGLTVQSEPHVGHIRAAMIRDILMRWLSHLGYRVMALENFTDVDDKIIEKQKEQKRDWRMIAQDNISTYLSACDQLNITKATFYPRASQHIEEIIALIQRLVDGGSAYEKKGDVYFRVRQFPDYGKLSGKSIDELVSGARIAPTELKEDPLDFALWKAAKPGEPYWFSPWGKGRPGWHIECSAMSMQYLGETFDIHTGGEDLIFPHHENEIAQSVAATGKPFARFWLHNGWVTLTGEKMSKSTGHYSPIKEVLRKYSANVIRMFMLKTHYRKQLEYCCERLDEARAALASIITFLDNVTQRHGEAKPIPEPQMLNEFTDAMNDDLNTSRALSVIYELINRGYGVDEVKIAASVKYYLLLLGFRQQVEVVIEPYRDVMKIVAEVEEKLNIANKQKLLDSMKEWFYHRIIGIKHVDELYPKTIAFLLQMRNELRKEKDYELADYVRKRLLDNNIIVDDQGIDASTYRLEVK